MSTAKSNESFSCPIEGEDTTFLNQWKIAFDYMRKKFISSITFSLFKANYKEIYKKYPDKLKTMHELLCSQLTKSITGDLDEIYSENSIEFLLNSLENIIKHKQTKSQICWRPSGNPNEDLRDHIYPIKLKHKEQLQAFLTKLLMNNEMLLNTSAIKHAEILQMKKTNDDLHQEISGIISSFTGPDMESLEKTLESSLEEDG